MAALCASRWSAIGRAVEQPKKNGLTRAGLLMEVARDPAGAAGISVHKPTFRK